MPRRGSESVSCVCSVARWTIELAGLSEMGGDALPIGSWRVNPGARSTRSDARLMGPDVRRRTGLRSSVERFWISDSASSAERIIGPALCERSHLLFSFARVKIRRVGGWLLACPSPDQKGLESSMASSVPDFDKGSPTECGE